MRLLSLGSLKVQQAGSADTNAENIRSALARDLPELVPAVCSHDGAFVIVASGPSLPDHLDSIREDQNQGRPICAIKGAHDYLVEHGITPNLYISVEPRADQKHRQIRLKQENCIYLLASRCHPDLFDSLKDYKIMLWHSWSDESECEVWKAERKFGIAGGTTSGLRAINVAYVLGFRKFILYGMDSCLAKDKDTKRFSGERVGSAWIADVIVGGRRFWANGALTQQATEFQELYKYMPGLTIESKGDGLLSAIIAERKKRGLPA